ncbi:phosphopantetheine-binding protein [Roseateles flavus]|uniref:Phosphopantetheine-binding protein n=1 Tax=Roseateles flavus TaxID=3149041 RepID=A0ABV0GJ86_9BURK|nr:phosphopantetheine-binding protein [Burkholderiaceae bacterium]
MDKELKDLVLSLLQQQLPQGYRSEPLSQDSRLLDFGLDSLNMMSFWVAIERQGPAGIDIGRLDFGAMETVADVLRHVERLCDSIPAAS